MTPHPHAALMAEYAKDAAETDKPWLRWEIEEHGYWTPLNHHPLWPTACQYRRKRRMILVNGVKVHAPETEVPNPSTVFWGASPLAPGLTVRGLWAGDALDMRIFERGLLYLNESDAIERAKAMLITTPAEP